MSTTTTTKYDHLGLANWPLVIRYIYDYMEIIKQAGPQQWVFDEMKNISQIKYGE